MSTGAATKGADMTATASQHAVYFQTIDRRGTTRVLREVDPVDTTALVNAVDDVTEGYAAQLLGGRDYWHDLDHAGLVSAFRTRLLKFAARLHDDPDLGASLRVAIEDDEGQAEVTYRVVCEQVTA